jgi:CRISPR-associated protein Csh1
MIKDMTKNFKAAVEKNENIIFDNFKCKDGLYIRLNKKIPFEITEENYLIINNKKDEVKKINLINWFKERDYCSVILNDDTNKAIDLPAKKIHSTNLFTYFIKKDICPMVGKTPIEIDKLKKLTEGYFEKLKLAEDKLLDIYTKSGYINVKPKKEDKEEFLQKYFSEEIKYIRSQERLNKIDENKKYILSNLDEIVKFINNFSKEHEFSGYIKLFFDNDIYDYRMESRIYTMPRIFNVNDYNIFMDNVIMGLPSNNITTNSKKPYLLLKTMQCNIPYRAMAKDVQTTKNYFEWLMAQGKFKEIKVDYNHKFDGTDAHKKDEAYYVVHLNKSAEIDDFDNVPFDLPKLDFKLENVLRITEKLNKDDKNSERVVVASRYINDYDELQKNFFEYFFNNRIQGYIKDLEPSIRSNEFTGQMRALFMYSRDALNDFFSKGVGISLKMIINKLTIELVEEELKHTVQGFNFNRVSRAYNLRISLLKYFKDRRGKDLADKIRFNMENLRTKLSSDGLVICENAEEFYFIAGQLAYYLLSQSESDKKNFGIFEPILNAKDSNQLKKRLQEIFAVYKHAVLISNIKFKNAMSMVMGYETEAKIKDEMKDMLLAGLLANNIFYVKKEDGKNAK